MENSYYEKFGTLPFAAALVAVLALAWLLSAAFSAVSLTEPIALPNSGLSVQMPKGPDWRTNDSWQFQDNTFLLTSFYTAGTKTPQAMVNARYVLAANGQSPERRINNRLQQSNLSPIRDGVRETDQLEFNWVLLQAKEPGHIILFALAQLDHGRILEIEIQNSRADTANISRIFKAVANSVDIQPNNALAAGIELVQNISTQGLGQFVGDQGQAQQFLITDQKGKVAGFCAEFAHVPDLDDETAIQSASLIYIAGQMESFVSLEASDDLSAFTCRAQMTNPAGSEAVNLFFEDQRLSMLKASSADKTIDFYPSGAMLMTAPMALAAQAIVQHQADEFIIDVLTSQGRLTPVLITVRENPDDSAARWAVNFSTEPGKLWQKWLLDENFSIIQSTVYQQDSTLTWQRTDAQTIKEHFPAMSEYIMDEQMIRALKAI